MYDISSDKKRRKVEKLLSSYGNRVNYSVFEIKTKKSKFNLLIKDLISITSKEDNIRVYILNSYVIKKSFILHSKNKVFEDEELYF